MTGAGDRMALIARGHVRVGRRRAFVISAGAMSIRFLSGFSAGMAPAAG